MGREHRVIADLSASGHQGSIYCITAVSDKEVATGCADGIIRVWNLETTQMVRALEGHEDEVLCMSWLSGWPWLLISGSADMTLRVWDLSMGQCMEDGVLEGHSDAVSCVAEFDPRIWRLGSAMKRCISGSFDHTIRIWPVWPAGPCERVITGHSGPVRCVLGLGEGRFVSGSEDRTLKVWQRDGTCESTLEGHTDFVSCMVAIGEGVVVSG